MIDPGPPLPPFPPDHAGFPADLLECSLSEGFERQVRHRPDSVAVLARAGSLTYAGLNRAANRLAARILAEAGPGEEPVALLLDQGLESVCATLAVLKAGKFYLPLDPSYPPAFLESLLEDAGRPILLAADGQAGLATRLSAAARRVVSVHLDPHSPAPEIPTPPGSDRPACLFYTSGSTGRPKGVIDHHRNVVHNILRYTVNLGISPSDRLSMIQSPTFSGTVSSLFGALLNGAAVCPFPLREEGFAALARWCREVGVTIYHSVPSLLRGLVEGGGFFPAVRVVRLEGDQVLPSDVALCARHFRPDCLLAVGLGATETGLVAQDRRRVGDPPPDGIVSLGHPTRDVSIAILGPDGCEVAPGRVGEIAVRSRYLATGYWRQPELTQAAFRPDPAGPEARVYRTGDLGRVGPDGRLEYLGRADSQPKILGQRVNLAEVEAVLSGTPGIRAAAVVVQPDPAGESRLVAYLVADESGRPGTGELHRRVADRLPAAQVPAEYVFLEALPVTEAGKVDRRSLPRRPISPARPLGETDPPVTSLEAAVADLWGDVLGISRPGRRQGLFELGGQSLAALRIVSRVATQFGVEVPMALLLEDPTVAGLCTRIEALLAADAEGRGPVARRGPSLARLPRKPGIDGHPASGGRPDRPEESSP